MESPHLSADSLKWGGALQRRLSRPATSHLSTSNCRLQRQEQRLDPGCCTLGSKGGPRLACTALTAEVRSLGNSGLRLSL